MRIRNMVNLNALPLERPEKMIPNNKYLIYFPNAALPEAKAALSRSSCLRIGSYLIIRKIISEYHLDEMLKKIIGDESDLFLDLAAYSIVTGNNAGQYYLDYAYNHPLQTEEMKIVSGSKVSKFINSLEKKQSVDFLNQWSKIIAEKTKLYISYDSTNKNCQAGKVELAVFGHAKDDASKPIISYSVGHDSKC